MKRLITVFVILLCLCSCGEIGKEDVDPNQKYLSLIESIFDHTSFSETSNHFDITAQMAKIDDGYRFYVTIDNPRNALYDVEAIAVEKDVDYSKTMAANVGIFEENEYSLIPNQTNAAKGYVEGLVMSGVTSSPETTLYVYVSYKNESLTETESEYFKLDVKYEN